MHTVITNGKIITETQILKDFDIILNDSKIQAIFKPGTYKIENANVVDCNDSYVMPGIVDIHSDMIESLIQPRSTAMMDFELGLLGAERILTTCGITTIFHSISMYREGTWDAKDIRQAPLVRKIANMIQEYKKKDSMIHHKYHLRYEIDNFDCYNQVMEMLENNQVDLISFMDHSPGQGQYKNLEIYRKHQPDEGRNMSEQEFAHVVETEMNKKKLTGEMLKALSDIAIANGRCIASHDDDTVDKLQLNKKLGVKISEFPITMEVANEAIKEGFLTVLGAPNVLLGGSHSGNLSALEAIKAGVGSILVSDYYPQALLQAVFKLHNQNNIELIEAVKMVTSNPAKATGIYKTTGSIEEGKDADLLIVRLKEDRIPFLEKVFVSGKCVMSCQNRGV